MSNVNVTVNELTSDIIVNVDNGETVVANVSGGDVVSASIENGDVINLEIGSQIGRAGVDGESAYQIALNNGFVGTEEEWLASLIGETGAVGPTGPQGPQGPIGQTGPAGTTDYNELENKPDLSGYLTISGAALTYHPLENQRLGTANNVSFASAAVNAVDFSTITPLLPYNVGRVRWNDTDKCIEYDTVDGSTIQIAQETTVYARNESGALLANGKAVVASGAVGQRLTFGIATNLNVVAQNTIGLVTTPTGIANNGFGLVTVFGLVRDVDTGAYNEGDELWLSTNGNYSNAIPTAEGEYVVRIGFVIRANSSTGSIFVAPHYHGTTTGFAITEATSQLAARNALGLGTLATQSGNFSGDSSGTNTGDQNIFGVVAVAGQGNITANSTNTTLTFVAGSNITITTDSNARTVSIAASGGSASATSFVPVGSIEATNVQDALAELESSKVNNSGGVTNMQVISYSDYLALGTVSPTTIYLVTYA